MSDPAHPGAGGKGGEDPSMEDILASIRRILSEDEGGGEAPPAEAGGVPVHEPPPASRDVLALDESMMVPTGPAAPAAERRPASEQPPRSAPDVSDRGEPPPPASASLVAPAAAAAAVSSMGALVRAVDGTRTDPVQVTRSGVMLEDIVRDELRPMLKAWLDAQLPALVERLVRAEIERLVGRAHDA